MMNGFQRNFLSFFVWVAIPSISSTPSARSEDTNAATKKAAIANNRFAFDLLRSLSQSEGKGKNIFYSPYSISVAVAMTSLGAAGKTLTEIEEALYFNEVNTTEDKLAFHEAGKQLIEVCNSDASNYSLTTANRLYGHKGFKILESFQKNGQKYYHAELEQLDFTSGKAEGTINKWVEDQTDNKIKYIIAPESLRDVVLVLVNAIYFKGTWEETFDAHATMPQDFYLSVNQKKQVDMMGQRADFKYSHCPELKSKILEMPYKGDHISMFVVLPDDVEGLATVIQQLSVTHVQKMLKNDYKQEVVVSFPKFKLETSYYLEDTLAKMGIYDLFSSRADLSHISTETKLKISKVIHKTFVKVNEQGTEAAAATVFKVFPVSLKLTPPATFTVDHPFYFAIIDTRVGNVLFSGTVSEP